MLGLAGVVAEERGKELQRLTGTADPNSWNLSKWYSVVPPSPYAPLTFLYAHLSLFE